MVADLLKTFDSISLAGLQEKSELMERREIKYLLHINKLSDVLALMKEEYEILDINNIRMFHYENVYFDTPEYYFYHQHLSQKDSRTKIRTRKYVDSHLDFVEYKQKIKNVIKKERITIGEEEFGNMSPETISFLEGCFKNYYDSKEQFTLVPVLRNGYQRITLCHKTKKERVTIDMNVSYYDTDSKQGDQPKHALSHLAIIECKHDEKKPFFKELMQKHNTPEIHLCSKYCLGAYYLGKTKQHKTFLPTIIYIDTLYKNSSLPIDFSKSYQERITANKRERNVYQTAGMVVS